MGAGASGTALTPAERRYPGCLRQGPNAGATRRGPFETTLHLAVPKARRGTKSDGDTVTVTIEHDPDDD